jgi:hypothetical protein
MPAHVFPDPPLDLIKQRLTIDPDRGVLHWSRSIGRYVKAGAIVTGTLGERSKVMYVAIGRRKIPATQIAWFLIHGYWPDHPVGTKNHKPFDLRAANLIPVAMPEPKNTPAAVAMRKYRAKVRAGKRLELMADYPHIQYVQRLDHWVVLDPDFFVRDLLLPRREFGPYPTFAAAHRFAKQHEERMIDIMSSPPRIDDDEAYTATAGPDGAALADFEITVWLDDRTGRFYWRSRDVHHAQRADQPAERGRYLQLKGRKYPAHAVVWFMHYAQWPDRKAIIHKNGNPNDNRIDNLALRIRK